VAHLALHPIAPAGQPPAAPEADPAG